MLSAHLELRLDQRQAVEPAGGALKRRGQNLLQGDERDVDHDQVGSVRKLLRAQRPGVAALECAAGRFDCLALIKPQFEVGREHVGSGVVRDSHQRRRALIEVGLEASRLGASVLGYASSGLPGPKGNQETFVRLSERSREGLGQRDLELAAGEVEP